MNPMETIGRLYSQLETEKANHLKTMAILHGVVKGEIDKERLTLYPNGWNLSPETNGKFKAPRMMELPDEIPVEKLETLPDSPAPSTEG